MKRAAARAAKPRASFEAWVAPIMPGERAEPPQQIPYAETSGEAAQVLAAGLFKSGKMCADHLPFDVLVRDARTKALQRYRVDEPPKFVIDALRTCRECGCSDDCACDPPCSWIAIDLCSACKKTKRKAVR